VFYKPGEVEEEIVGDTRPQSLGDARSPITLHCDTDFANSSVSGLTNDRSRCQTARSSRLDGMNGVVYTSVDDRSQKEGG